MAMLVLRWSVYVLVALFACVVSMAYAGGVVRKCASERAVSYQDRRCWPEVEVDAFVWHDAHNVVVVRETSKDKAGVKQDGVGKEERAPVASASSPKVKERFSWRGQGAAMDLPDSAPHKRGAQE